MMDRKCPFPMLVSNPKREDWIYFKRLFQNYVSIVEAEEAAKLPLLQNALGRDGLSIFDGLPEKKDTYDQALACLDTYFSGSSSVLLNRKRFFQARQGPGETIAEFAGRLRRLSSDCAFKDASEMLRDVFVIGVRNDHLAERLLTQDAATLTFEKAVTKAETVERATSDRSQMTTSTDSPTVLKVERPGEAGSSKSRLEKRRGIFCHRCGIPGQKAGHSNCKARNADCKKCGNRGHFAKVCRTKFPQSRHNSQANQVQQEPDLCDPVDHTIYTVSTDNHVSLLINDTLVKCVADTGASINIIPLHLCPVKFEKAVTSRTLRTYGGYTLKVIGHVLLRVAYKNVTVDSKFAVVDVKDDYPLLCTDLCNKLGILTEMIQNINSVSDDLNEFDCLFEGIGKVKDTKCELKVSSDAIPKSSPSRRLTPHLLAKVKDQLELMQKEEIIKPAECTEWLSPIVPVMKKSGEVRICVDFRYLNQYVVREPYQIPTFEDIFSKLTNAQYFSQLDAKSGYHQLEMSEDSQKYLCFSTPVGNFQFCRMPFGISSAPEMYQKVMSSILDGCPGVLFFLDDILIFGRTKLEHDTNLKNVLRKLKNCGIRLNRDKCKFSTTKVEFLGHEISDKGIKPSATKINSILNFPVPKNASQCRSFLGLLEYAGHKFIKNFADVCAPMYDVIAGDFFSWNDNAQKSFERVKKELSSLNYLRFFDPEKKITIRTDASGIGLGAVLMQDDEPVLFISRKLRDPETRYSQIEREFLAIVFAMHRFKTFVLGTKVNLQTDNKPLISFFSKPIDKLPLRVQKWMLNLQPFSMQIEHIPAHKNKISDDLSRNPCDAIPDDCEMSSDTCFFTFSDIPLTKSEIIKASLEDTEIQQLKKNIQFKWKQDTLSKPYDSMREEMSVSDDGVVMIGSRIVLPRVLRKKALAQAHSGHVGSEKMKNQLRAIFFWSRMTAEIEEYVKQCDACVRFSRENKRAPLTTVADNSTASWDVISVDFTGGSERLNGVILFTVIDHYSRFPFVYAVKQSSARCVIQCLKHLFSTYGFPHTLVSDNGTAFTRAEFNVFLSRCGVQHRYASVYYPEGNSTVERFHGTLKSRLDKLLHEGVDFDTAMSHVMYDIRSLPNKSIGVSPFEKFFNRPMPTRWNTLIKEGFSGTRIKLSEVYGRRNQHSRYSTKTFKEGEKVLLRRGPTNKFVIPATIVRSQGHGAWLVNQNGKRQVYNQKFIKPAPVLPVEKTLASKTKECYDMLDAWEKVEDSDMRESEPVCSPSPRYFLRSNRKRNYRL